MLWGNMAAKSYQSDNQSSLAAIFGRLFFDVR